MARESLIITAVLIVIILITTPSSASDAENPLYEKYKGILSQWHKARICMPCHINTLSGEELDKFTRCSPCHNQNINLKNQEQILEIHGNDVCIKCHVGSQYDTKTIGLKIHTPHKNLNCSKCHGGDSRISKPDRNMCIDCHGSNPHSVHSKILDEICFDCHSENMKDYLPEINKETLTSQGIVELPKQENQKETKIEIKSLSDLIIWILNMLF